jgi:hypothetical protein
MADADEIIRDMMSAYMKAVAEGDGAIALSPPIAKCINTLAAKPGDAKAKGEVSKLVEAEIKKAKDAKKPHAADALMMFLRQLKTLS